MRIHEVVQYYLELWWKCEAAGINEKSLERSSLGGTEQESLWAEENCSEIARGEKKKYQTNSFGGTEDRINLILNIKKWRV